METNTLATPCPVCKAPPGQPCDTQRVPFHAARIDKGNALARLERIERVRELEDLL